MQIMSWIIYQIALDHFQFRRFLRPALGLWSAEEVVLLRAWCISLIFLRLILEKSFLCLEACFRFFLKFFLFIYICVFYVLEIKDGLLDLVSGLDLYLFAGTLLLATDAQISGRWSRICCTFGRAVDVGRGPVVISSHPLFFLPIRKTLFLWLQIFIAENLSHYFILISI